MPTSGAEKTYPPLAEARVRTLVARILFLSGAIRFASWWHRKHVVILNYHGIMDDQNSSADPLDLTVTTKNFRRQINYLSHRHKVISLREFLKAQSEGSALPDYSIVLTFDDGYRNFLTASSLLLNQNLPATLFLVTRIMRPSDGVTEGEGSFEDRLSWAEVEALDRNGNFAFGSHTRSHPSLSNLSLEALDHELRTSLQEIESRVKNVMPALAYPNGDYTGVPLRQIADSGYVCGLTIDAGPNNHYTNPYYLHRQTIRGSDDLLMFAARLSCLTYWLYGWRLSAQNFLGPFASWFGIGQVSLTND